MERRPALRSVAARARGIATWRVIRFSLRPSDFRRRPLAGNSRKRRRISPDELSVFSALVSFLPPARLERGRERLGRGERNEAIPTGPPVPWFRTRHPL